MNDATAKLLAKAGRAIAAGESALREGHIEAVSRASQIDVAEFIDDLRDA